jgi:CubicO group peptidase (beta-lactamase class C family)
MEATNYNRRSAQMRKATIAICVFVIAVAVAAWFIAPMVFHTNHNPPAANPSPAASGNPEVDKLFAQWNRPDSPGCSLAASKNGTVVYERGYGMANLESGAAITPASVFHVASIAKQFTAMSILLLAKSGKLSLDEDVKTYIPEWADHGSRITIRHLLTHTSGLRDAYLLSDLSPSRGESVGRMDAIVGILARARGLNFTPGAEFEYNNGGYTLLADIVKRVSGQSLSAFTETNIFKPLGMTHTHFHDDPSMIVPNRAVGYRFDAGGFHIALHDDLGRIVGNTGLFTTARDLLLWEQNFADARVGGRELITAMQTPAIPTGFPDGSSYGLGLEIGQYRGLRTIGHGGSDPGYGAYTVRYPDQGFAVAVLCNLENIGASAEGLTQRVADIWLLKAFATPAVTNAAVAPAGVRLSPAQLADRSGLYFDRLTGALVRIFVRDGELMERDEANENGGVDLTPIDANRVVIPGTPAVLEFMPQQIHWTGSGPRSFVLQKVDSYTPSDADLRALSGEYTSEELEGAWTLTARDSHLVIQIPGRADIVLRPVFADAFAGAIVGVVKFSRNADGGFTRFTVITSGARGVAFRRVKR